MTMGEVVREVWMSDSAPLSGVVRALPVRWLRTVIADEMDGTGVPGKAHGMILHARASAYVAQDEDLDRVFRILGPVAAAPLEAVLAFVRGMSF